MKSSKEKYEAPEMEIICFDCNDIITQSGEDPEQGEWDPNQ